MTEINHLPALPQSTSDCKNTSTLEETLRGQNSVILFEPLFVFPEPLFEN